MTTLSKVFALAAIFFSICTLFGCSATKQTYHNITARNNSYFNAKQKLKGIQKNIAAAHQDNYDSLLILRPSMDPALAQNYSSELDEVVKKASFSIKRHEPSKWTDNNYLLVGKSYFLKDDQRAALEAFKFITTEFKDEVKKEEVKKKKKRSLLPKRKRKRKKAVRKNPVKKYL